MVTDECGTFSFSNIAYSKVAIHKNTFLWPICDFYCSRKAHFRTVDGHVTVYSSEMTFPNRRQHKISVSAHIKKIMNPMIVSMLMCPCHEFLFCYVSKPEYKGCYVVCCLVYMRTSYSAQCTVSYKYIQKRISLAQCTVS